LLPVVLLAAKVFELVSVRMFALTVRTKFLLGLYLGKTRLVNNSRYLAFVVAHVAPNFVLENLRVAQKSNDFILVYSTVRKTRCSA